MLCFAERPALPRQAERSDFFKVNLHLPGEVALLVALSNAVLVASPFFHLILGSGPDEAGKQIVHLPLLSGL